MCARKLVRVEVAANESVLLDATSFQTDASTGNLLVRREGDVVAIFARWVGVYFVDAQ